MRSERAVKKLRATAEAAAYQKQWFRETQQRVESGEDFAYVNADVPMEILRAMDIPFVVNQWWAAICGAKQMTSKYFGLLREAGYRDDLCSYCATAFAESLDTDDRLSGPWGGLPSPTISITRLACDCQGKIFELFSKRHGAQLYTLENTCRASCRSSGGSLTGTTGRSFTTRTAWILPLRSSGALSVSLRRKPEGCSI